MGYFPRSNKALGDSISGTKQSETQREKNKQHKGN